LLETTEQLPLIILDETSKPFPKFNKTGRNLLIKFKSTGEEQEPTAYLKECITAFTNYLVEEVNDRDWVGLRIRNTENVQDLVWDIFSNVIQNNARFGLTDRLEVHLDQVRMPIFRCNECY